MKQFILEQLSQLKIKDYGKLEEYVDFCLKNNLKTKIPRKTAEHHILPRSKTLPFKIYENLKENPWNKVILSNYNHYYAHFLLANAISHISISNAFCAMHKKDVVNGRINKEDLILEAEFDKIYTERNKQSSEYLKEIIDVNGVKMSRASYFISNRKPSKETSEKRSKRMRGDNNIVHKDGVVDKIRKTKLEKNLDSLCAERAAITMKKEYIDENGMVTTIYKENGKKLSKTLQKEIIDENGNVTTLAKKRGKAKSLQMIRDGCWYKIKNIFNKNVEIILPAAFVRKISPALDKKTKKDYLGKSAFGRNMFIRQNREFLIGLYAEILPEAPKSYNLDQDYSPYL